MCNCPKLDPTPLISSDQHLIHISNRYSRCQNGENFLCTYQIDLSFFILMVSAIQRHEGLFFIRDYLVHLHHATHWLLFCCCISRWMNWNIICMYMWQVAYVVCMYVYVTSGTRTLRRTITTSCARHSLLGYQSTLSFSFWFTPSATKFTKVVFTVRLHHIIVKRRQRPLYFVHDEYGHTKNSQREDGERDVQRNARWCISRGVLVVLQWIMKKIVWRMGYIWHIISRQFCQRM